MPALASRARLEYHNFLRDRKRHLVARQMYRERRGIFRQVTLIRPRLCRRGVGMRVPPSTPSSRRDNRQTNIYMFFFLHVSTAMNRRSTNVLGVCSCLRLPLIARSRARYMQRLHSCLSPDCEIGKRCTRTYTTKITTKKKSITRIEPGQYVRSSRVCTGVLGFFFIVTR